MGADLTISQIMSSRFANGILGMAKYPSALLCLLVPACVGHEATWEPPKVDSIWYVTNGTHVGSAVLQSRDRPVMIVAPGDAFVVRVFNFARGSRGTSVAAPDVMLRLHVRAYEQCPQRPGMRPDTAAVLATEWFAPGAAKVEIDVQKHTWVAKPWDAIPVELEIRGKDSSSSQGVQWIDGLHNGGVLDRLDWNRRHNLRGLGISGC